MTEKLYYTDGSMREFTAAVVSCTEEDGRIAVELDRTAFFPEGGGQAPDTGRIGNAEVSDVREKNGRILHYVNRPLVVGTKHDCVLDWEKRLRRMQNHTGEHIVSGLVHKKYGYNNVGFHMGHDFVTVDFDGDLAFEQLSEIEAEANAAVAARHPVRCFFPTSEELSSLDYRSKLDLIEDVRLVEIEGIDLCACCAPHLPDTSGVGIVKIIDSERRRRGGDGVRITMLCGLDAYEYLAAVQRNNDAVSNLLSAKRLETAQGVRRLLADAEEKKSRIAELSGALSAALAELQPEGEENLCLFENRLDPAAVRALVNALTLKCGGAAAVFSGDDEHGYSYIIGSAAKDLRKASKSINEALCGRGGGSPEMISGRVNGSAESIKKYFKELKLLT